MISQNLSELDYRLLSMLYSNSRVPVNKLSEELGVSRATVTRSIKRLTSLGVIKRFTIELGRGYDPHKVFVRTSTEPKGAEYYCLVGGGYIAIYGVRDMEQLSSVLRSAGNVLDYWITESHVAPENAPPLMPVCDECGKPVTGSVLAYKKGRRTYYACCTTCLEALRSKK